VSIKIEDLQQRPLPYSSQAEKKKSREQSSNIWNKEITLLGKKLTDKKKEAFYSELFALLSSGVDIKSSLEIVVEEQKKQRDKEIYTDILNKVLLGATLSEAIRSCKEFVPYEYHSIRIGEESGRLNDVLHELSAYYNKRLKQRKQITGALTYPILVLITAIGAVIFMMNFIIPMFMGVFQRFGGELPGITRFIVKVSEIFSNHIGFFMLLGVCMFMIYLFVRKKSWYRRIFSPILIKFPIVGNMVNKIYLVRFCHSMALLIGSKTPLIKAVQLVREMIGFFPYQRDLKQIEEDLLQGGLLHESMSRSSIFDRRVISLVKVGEEINQLDDIFEKLYKQYNEELEHRIGMLSNLLEPVMILFVGILVAIILIAMYLPLFQMSTSFY